MTIYIRQHGQGVPLVFFHGWGFDSQIWLPLVSYLENFYRLILVDLPGFGLTPMMEWDTFKDALLLALPPRFALIGWSMGGLCATRLALEEPGRVSHLLNIASSPRFIADLSWPGVSKELFINFYKNLSSDVESTLRDFIALQMNKTRFSFRLGHLPSPEGLRCGLDSLEHWDLRQGLGALQLPVSYIFGRLDPITPVKTMETMQVIYPDFKYVLFQKAAHMPFLSHRELFVETVLDFIK